MSTKVLLCGAGMLSQELLKRLGETWSVTLLDVSEQKLLDFSKIFASVQRVVAGEASSPVILDRADLAGHDYVLALTEDDEVNLAVCAFAREREVRHILAQVLDAENLPRFHKLDVRVLTPTLQQARELYHYLVDPRVRITPIAMGQGEIMEVDVLPSHWFAGKRLEVLIGHNWRVVAVLREGWLQSARPDMTVVAGDRLVILGAPDMLRPVCTLLDCAQPRFPMTYGRGLLLALPAKHERELGEVLDECLYVAQSLKTGHLEVRCEKACALVDERLGAWSQSLRVGTAVVQGRLSDTVKALCEDMSIGLVAMPSVESGFFETLGKAPLMELAHSLPCPLLLLKGRSAYRRLLVPCNGTPRAELALEIGMDLGKQLSAQVDVVVVREPGFLHGDRDDDQDGDWVERSLARARELSHVHKVKLGEFEREGNPVHEVVALATDYDLLVLGSTRREAGLFSPHVGEHLARKAPCSVLVVTG